MNIFIHICRHLRLNEHFAKVLKFLCEGQIICELMKHTTPTHFILFIDHIIIYYNNNKLEYIIIMH